jgi:hypothetical protein
VNGGTGWTVTVPASRRTAVTDSTAVPDGAFTEMDEHVNEVAAELAALAEAAALGRHAATTSGTPAAKLIRRRFMTFTVVSRPAPAHQSVDGQHRPGAYGDVQAVPPVEWLDAPAASQGD